MRLPILPCALLVVTCCVARADVVECDNGDRYNGRVLSMDEKEVKLQNDIAGTITIPRVRIVGIQFRPAPAPVATGAATNAPAVRAQAPTWDAALLERIQNEYLATATPEANQMFQEMVQGMQSGRIALGDLRARAAATLRDLRAAQKESGEDALGGILETYGEVLESFLQQTAAGARAPAVPSARAQPKAAPGR
ncbi:MAG: hypothetical protein JNL10_18010 [Verrucomicrobiales bacterium]|nr:hypothetical protein [Verrucomicrobiales bacterium]